MEIQNYSKPSLSYWKRLAIESGLCKAGVWERGATEIYG